MLKNLKMIRTKGMIKRELDMKSIIKRLGIKERNILFELDVESGLKKIEELISQLNESQQQNLINLFKEIQLEPKIADDEKRKSIILDRYRINFQIENCKLPVITNTETNSRHSSKTFKSEKSVSSSRQSKKSISTSEIYKEIGSSLNLKMVNFDNLSNLEKIDKIAKYNKF